MNQPRDAQYKKRAIASYYGLALGDALGATVEFMLPREIEHQYGVHKDIIGGGWLRLKKGEVTDDTTMSLALGDAILESDGFNAVAIADSFDQWMRSKPVDIGHTVRRGILHYRTTAVPVVPLNEHDGGNGACMRTLPVAIASYTMAADVIEDAVKTHAYITHNNPLSDAGTLCVVEMLHRAYAGGSLVELYKPVKQLIERHPEFAFRRKKPSTNPSGFIVHTLRTVFECFFDSDNFETCLVETVNRGGDADTTGAIIGMIAGALYGIEGIPPRWLKALKPEVKQRVTMQAEALVDFNSRHCGQNHHGSSDINHKISQRL